MVATCTGERESSECTTHCILGDYRSILGDYRAILEDYIQCRYTRRLQSYTRRLQRYTIGDYKLHCR